MRKYISIIILFIFLFNIGGYYLWFSVLQYHTQKEIEKEIEEGSKDEHITLIIVPVADEQGICWIKPNKEFRYKGELYDIVKIQHQHQKKYYYCLNDSKEKQLIADFNKTHNTKKESEKKLKRSFNYSFYLQRFSITKNVYPIDFAFAATTILYKPNTIDILSPPPKST
jgi:predicted transcriptional regulator